jgi:hypothetical protein
VLNETTWLWEDTVTEAPQEPEVPQG